jgi:hypothetical protein
MAATAPADPSAPLQGGVNIPESRTNIPAVIPEYSGKFQ